MTVTWTGSVGNVGTRAKPCWPRVGTAEAAQASSGSDPEHVRGAAVVDGLRWISGVWQVPSQQIFMLARATLSAKGGGMSSRTPTGAPIAVHGLPEKGPVPQPVSMNNAAKAAAIRAGRRTIPTRTRCCSSAQAGAQSALAAGLCTRLAGTCEVLQARGPDTGER